MTQDPTVHTCAECGVETPLDEVTREESINDKLREVHILCSCGLRTHVYFNSDDLDQSAAKVRQALAAFRAKSNDSTFQQYKTIQAAHRRRFDKLQKRWRSKFKMYG